MAASSEGDECEGAKESGGHALACDGVGEDFIDRLERDRRAGWGRPRERHCERGGERRPRIERRTNEQDGVKAETGKIDFRFRVGVDAEVARVGDDADDGNLAGSGAHNADENVGAERIARG